MTGGRAEVSFANSFPPTSHWENMIHPIMCPGMSAPLRCGLCSVCSYRRIICRKRPEDTCPCGFSPPFLSLLHAIEVYRDLSDDYTPQTLNLRRNVGREGQSPRARAVGGWLLKGAQVGSHDNFHCGCGGSCYLSRLSTHVAHH